MRNWQLNLVLRTTPPTRKEKKRRTTSTTDQDCGYINHGNKRGVGYLMEITVDCKNGILTGVDVLLGESKRRPAYFTAPGTSASE